MHKPKFRVECHSTSADIYSDYSDQPLQRIITSKEYKLFFDGKEFPYYTGEPVFTIIDSDGRDPKNRFSVQLTIPVESIEFSDTSN